MTFKHLLLDDVLRIDAMCVRLTIHDWYQPLGFFVYQFEFRSIDDPPRPIPVSPTGYRSHFITTDTPLSVSELSSCAQAIAHALLRKSSDISQLDLFA